MTTTQADVSRLCLFHQFCQPWRKSSRLFRVLFAMNTVSRIVRSKLTFNLKESSDNGLAPPPRPGSLLSNFFFLSSCFPDLPYKLAGLTGYCSDTQSLTDSVTNYPVEHGRRYHSYHEGCMLSFLLYFSPPLFILLNDFYHNDRVSNPLISVSISKR